MRGSSIFNDHLADHLADELNRATTATR